MIEYLPWDSSFFNFKTGKAIINDLSDIPLIREHFDQSDYKLIYLFDFNTNDSVVDLLNKKGIPLIDSKITYSFTGNNRSEPCCRKDGPDFAIIQSRRCSGCSWNYSRSTSGPPRSFVRWCPIPVF